MSIQPLEQAIASTRAVLINVTAEQLSAPTPCASWNVGQLIDHMVGVQQIFGASLAGEEPPEGGDKPSEGDYISAFDEASAQCLAAFSREGLMEEIVKVPFGEMPGSAFMGLAATDTLTHGWDLAKATGQSTDLAPEYAAAMLQQSQMAIQDSFRGADGEAPFGPEQQVPEGATKADQLAAFLGRTI